MGLFKSSKQPSSGPLPSLALQLTSSQDKVFKPNDTIAGQITLSTPVPLNPKALEVSFWGESSVWIRTRHNNTTGAHSSTQDYYHWRDNAPLFAVTFNLLPPKSDSLQPGQTYTFPFSIQVPAGTGNKRNGCYKNDRDERWTTQPHNLPPTFFYGSSLDEPDNASVSYGVTARLLCPGVGVGKHGEEPVSSTAPILFQPLNPHIGAPLSVVRYTRTYTLSSSALSGAEPSSIGFRQRMSDRFSSSTPKVDFELGTELPDLLTSGSEFSFRSTLTVLKKSDNVVTVPTITLKVLKLELLDFTFLRAPRDWDASHMMDGHHYKSDASLPTGPYSGQEETIYKEKKTPLNAIPNSKVLQLEEVASGEKKEMVQAGMCETWFTARVPGFTPPSFRSFAISRMYRIRVKMGVEVGGKKFEAEAESHVRELGSVP